MRNIFFISVSLFLVSFNTAKRKIVSNIYDYQFTALNGQQINLSAYTGKKILLVNIASESEYAHVQIPQLELLQQLHESNLIIIGFSSNDFGNEPRTNAELSAFLNNTYAAHFLVSTLINVKLGTTNLHPLYNWLQDSNQNTSMSLVSGDFHKYLFDEQGNMAGSFSGEINPMDTQIRNILLN